MKLSFKPPNVRNTEFTNEQGHVLYSTSTSLSCLTKVMKHDQDEFDIANWKDESSELLAEIQWHTFSSSVIKCGGKDLPTSQFIPSKGFLGRRRVFVGPDGRLYKWKIGLRECILMLDDMEVARHHRRRVLFNPNGPVRDAYLEIFPQAEHMVDLVVLTFIYVEKLQRPGMGRMHVPKNFKPDDYYLKECSIW